MKGCIHDYTLLEDECDCIRPHTNTADTGMPHTSLVQYIAQLEHERAQLERERNALRGQLVATLEERLILAERVQILRSAAT
jgi:hypothetical protein